MEIAEGHIAQVGPWESRYLENSLERAPCNRTVKSSWALAEQGDTGAPIMLAVQGEVKEKSTRNSIIQQEADLSPSRGTKTAARRDRPFQQVDLSN